MGRSLARVPAAAPEWISPDVAIAGQIGTVATTAQVNPAAFTIGMMRAAEARDVKLLLGETEGCGDVVGVLFNGGTLEADAVVIAIGPRSVLAAKWLPLLPVFSLKGHSLVFQADATIPPEALFLEHAETDGSMHPLEVFPRADITTCVCGISSESSIRIDPGLVAPDDG